MRVFALSRWMSDGQHTTKVTSLEPYSGTRTPISTMLITARWIAASLRSCSADATIVFYGYGHYLGFWLMKAYGHERALVLKGTREGWRDAGRPWTTALPKPVASRYTLPEAETTQLISLDALQGTLGSGDPLILDVRSDAEFTGERFWPSGTPEGAGRPGHIPGAVHLHTDLLRTADGVFKNAARFSTSARCTPCLARPILRTMAQPRRPSWA
jgi:3-mercaptopyruvate sulfurtransferase SseA